MKYIRKSCAIVILFTLSSSAYSFCEDKIDSRTDSPAVYRSSTLAGEEVCLHTDGYAIKAYFDPATAEEAEATCEALSQQTGRQWFIPASGDIANLTGGGFIGFNLQEQLQRQRDTEEGVYVWYASLPVTAELSGASKETLDSTRRLIPSNVSPGFRLGNFIPNQDTADLRDVLASQNAFPFLCMTKATNDDLAEFSVGATFVDMQLKGRILNSDQGIRLRHSSIDRAGGIQPYTPDGSAVLRSNILVRGRTQRNNGPRTNFFFDREVEGFYLQYDQNPELRLNEIVATFPEKPVRVEPANATIAAQLRALSASENVLIRGQIALRERAVKVTSVTPLGQHARYFFSFCHAETEHFKTTRQGCAYLPNGVEGPGRIIFGTEAIKLETAPDELEVGLDRINFRSNLGQFKEAPLLNARTVPTIVNIVNNPAVNCFRNSPVNASNQCIGNIFSPDEVLPNGQIAGEFFEANPGPFRETIGEVGSFRALLNYGSYFPEGTFPGGISFKFAQRPTLEEIKAVSDEVNLSRKTPDGEFVRHETIIATLNHSNSFKVLLSAVIDDAETSETITTPISGPGGPRNIARRVFIPAPEPTSISDGVISFNDGRFGGFSTQTGLYRYPATVQVGPNTNPPNNVVEGPRIPKTVNLRLEDRPVLPPSIFQVNGTRVNVTGRSMLISDPIDVDLVESEDNSVPVAECSFARQSPSAEKADVNLDGTVSALDALLIINRLSVLGGGSDSCLARPLFLDANGDGNVTANDALFVINRIGRAQ